MSINNFTFFLTLMALTLLVPATLSAEEWQYQLEKGLVQQKARMYEYALFSLRKSLDLNPQNPRAARALAEIYDDKNQKELALEFYERSLALDEGQASLHVRAGELRELFQDYPRALEHFRRALELAPEDLMANLSLVRHDLRAGDAAAAERHWAASRSAGLARSRAELVRAAAAADRGAVRDAIARYRRILDQSPSLIEAYQALFDLYRRERDDTSAVEVMERLAFVKPDEERAFVLLGNVYFSGRVRGKRPVLLRKAEANYRKALALNPNNADTWFSLSSLARFMKRDLDAAAYEKKALELDRAAGR